MIELNDNNFKLIDHPSLARVNFNFFLSIKYSLLLYKILIIAILLLIQHQLSYDKVSKKYEDTCDDNGFCT